jgi:hypothetical protein
MNKLLVALCASVFALGSGSLLADDSSVKQISKMETQEATAARADAKAKWAKMTPEEQAATKKAAAAKNRDSWTATEEISSGIEYDSKKAAKDTAASKAGPAPNKGTLNTPAGNAALKKESSGQ